MSGFIVHATAAEGGEKRLRLVVADSERLHFAPRGTVKRTNDKNSGKRQARNDVNLQDSVSWGEKHTL